MVGWTAACRERASSRSAAARDFGYTEVLSSSSGSSHLIEPALSASKPQSGATPLASASQPLILTAVKVNMYRYYLFSPVIFGISNGKNNLFYLGAIRTETVIRLERWCAKGL